MVCAFLLVRRMTLPMSWQYCNKIRLIQSKMKPCKGCGTMISDSAGDFCERCLTKSKFNNVEKTVNILSNLLLTLGVIASIVMSFSIVVVEKAESFGRFTYSKKEFSPIGLVIVVSTLFSSILLWALLKLAIDVSVNIRTIAKNKECES